MVINTVMSHQFKFKFIPGFRTFLFPEKKDIHYIGGSDVPCLALLPKGWRRF